MGKRARSGKWSILAWSVWSLVSATVASAAEGPGPLATAASAQEASAHQPMVRGEVVTKVVSEEDSKQQFAVYLPRSYDPDRAWPVLFVMDPRGRAEMALDLFRPAAEVHGWILISSYQTRSDSNDDPNTPAIRAMLGDAQKRFSIDSRRLYLTGMSGTAKVCWPFARMLEGNVAGVIGVAGGLPQNMPLGDKVPFAFFGITSDHDFNYREMRELRHALHDLGAVHNFGVFEGPHGWSPQELNGQAVAWLELIAMRDGLAPPREDFIDTRWAAARSAAAQAEESGDLVLAYERLDQLARDFSGLRDVTAARERADELATSGEVRAAQSQERKLLRAERLYRGRIQRWLDRMAASTTPLPAQRSLADLQVKELLLDAAGNDSRAAQSAQRRLETAFVQTAFYLPTAYRQRDQFDRAQAVLEISTEIKPESAWPYWQLASLHTERGQVGRAFDALAKAAERGAVDLERLKRDPQWLPLHDDARWETFVSALGS